MWKASEHIVKKITERIGDISVIFFLSKSEQRLCEILVSHLGYKRNCEAVVLMNNNYI